MRMLTKPWSSPLVFLYYLNIIFSLTTLTAWYFADGKGLQVKCKTSKSNSCLRLDSFSVCSSLPHIAGAGRLVLPGVVDEVVIINACKVTLGQNGKRVWGHLGGEGSTSASHRKHLCNEIVSWPRRSVYGTSFLPWKNDRQTVVMELGNLWNISQKKKKKWKD